MNATTSGTKQTRSTSEVERLGKQNAELQRRLEALEEMVSVSAGLDAIGKGLADIQAELEPLRELVPTPVATRVGEGVPAALRGLLRSLRATDWSSIEKLPEPADNVTRESGAAPRPAYIHQVPLAPTPAATAKKG